LVPNIASIGIFAPILGDAGHERQIYAGFGLSHFPF
jgi:hypothetical protein